MRNRGSINGYRFGCPPSTRRRLSVVPGAPNFQHPRAFKLAVFFGAPSLAHQDIQQALNAIRGEVERVDDETKWAALELMLGTSSSLVALAKKMAKPETKTVTRKGSNLEISR